ncbi:MAG: 8-amino-7-oxononanoate synthase [Verrucomicrobia bacterium]|nr:8-amino-7-oxononanoate synthase [Verrucomicrobiota bacterium]
MSETLNQYCERALDASRNEGLHRTLRLVESPQKPVIRFNGRDYDNFSSNDYLGLANHPGLKRHVTQAIETHGIGAGASPLISGYQRPMMQLQRALADLKGTESALVFNSGYATAIGVIPALFGPKDILVIDKLSHASLIDGARKSGAKLRIFRHNDTQDLEKKLQWSVSQLKSDQTKEKGHIGIIGESVYSMDGDHAPLKRMVELKNSYGAWLMIDEAHSTGLYGDQGRGLIQREELSDQIEIQMGTLGKALGCSGGFIAGSDQLVDFLINKARSFIFSTALPPMVSAAAVASIQYLKSEEGDTLREKLFHNIRTFHDAIPVEWKNEEGSDGPGLHLHQELTTPILPWWVGDAEKAVQLSQELLTQGYFVPAIRYPTVPPSTSRLRITISASHTKAAINKLAIKLVQCHERLIHRT